MLADHQAYNEGICFKEWKEILSFFLTAADSDPPTDL